MAILECFDFGLPNVATLQVVNVLLDQMEIGYRLTL